MRLILAISIILILTSISIQANQNQTIAINLQIKECQITINTNKEIYEPKEQIKFYNNISIQNNFTIKYYIVDSQNQIIKNSVITKNINEKYFTPKESKTDQIITIISELQAPNCETNTEKSIFIKGNPNLIETATKTTISTAKTTTTKTITSKAPTVPKTTSNKTTAISKTKQTTQLNQQKSYEITPINSTTTLLNPKSEENTDEVIFSSSEEKARNFAKYSIFGAIFLFIIGVKSNGNKNKNNS